MSTRPIHLPCAVAALLLTTPGVFAADGPDLLEDSFSLSLGTFIVAQDTKLQLNGSAGTGTRIDWDKTFPDNDLTRFRVDGFWRFADRHKVRFLWFDASRSGARNIDEEIDWGDETYPIDARVRAETSFSVYELAYEYAFLRRENYEVTGSFGLHYTEFDASLSATLEDTDGGGGTRKASSSGSVGAPLPAFGVRGTYRLGGDFWLDGHAQYFALSIDEYDGNLSDLRIAVIWQPRKWVGVGLGYNRFAVDVDVEKNSFDGSLDWAYQGPQIFYNASF